MIHDPSEATASHSGIGGAVHYLPKGTGKIEVLCGLNGSAPSVNWDTDRDYVTCEKCLALLANG